MENWTSLIATIAPIITALVGILAGKRMQEAKAIKTEAEAKRVLAEAGQIMVESESKEVRSIGRVIQAWETLYAKTNDELDEVKREQRMLHSEYIRVLSELREYKRGVDILISQLRRLGHMPEWAPKSEE